MLDAQDDIADRVGRPGSDAEGTEEGLPYRSSGKSEVE